MESEPRGDDANPEYNKWAALESQDNGEMQEKSIEELKVELDKVDALRDFAKVLEGGWQERTTEPEYRREWLELEGMGDCRVTVEDDEGRLEQYISERKSDGGGELTVVEYAKKGQKHLDIVHGSNYNGSVRVRNGEERQIDSVESLEFLGEDKARGIIDVLDEIAMSERTYLDYRIFDERCHSILRQEEYSKDEKRALMEELEREYLNVPVANYADIGKRMKDLLSDVDMSETRERYDRLLEEEQRAEQEDADAENMREQHEATRGKVARETLLASGFSEEEVDRLIK